MNWHTHIVKPAPFETAVIAVIPHPGDFHDNKPFLLGEIYRFDPKHDCWIGEANGLILKHQTYFWMPEDQLLRSLTQ
jgi:hypothetical protein